VDEPEQLAVALELPLTEADAVLLELALTDADAD